MRQHSARRQVQRKFRIGIVGWQLMSDTVEPGASARGRKAVREQPRSACVMKAGTARPHDPTLDSRNSGKRIRNSVRPIRNSLANTGRSRGVNRNRRYSFGNDLAPRGLLGRSLNTLHTYQSVRL